MFHPKTRKRRRGKLDKERQQQPQQRQRPTATNGVPSSSSAAASGVLRKSSFPGPFAHKESHTLLPSSGKMTAPNQNNFHAAGAVHHRKNDQGPQHAHQISNLINYAKSNYEENPTEALGALMEAMKLNSGQEAVNRAMDVLKHELGDEIVHHVSSRHLRMQRAVKLVEELMADESTILFQRGKQDLLRQAMQDGSSVVCSRCHDIISANRWQQHQQYWCSGIDRDSEGTDHGNDGGDQHNNEQSSHGGMEY